MQFKRTATLIILLVMIFVKGNSVLGDDFDEELNYDFVYEEIETVNAEGVNGPNILSKTAVIYDRDCKKVLFGKCENEKVPMASTTKIMTAIILLENGDLTKTVTVDKKAGSIGGSRLGLNTKDEITLNDLLYGLMLCSRK